ncbi:MAG: DUF4174 domain-containing protein [Paracoccaceae bacterium]
MKRVLSIVLAAFLSFPLAAQEAGDDPMAALGPFPAAEVQLEDLLWLKRPIVVFADSPADPAFERQLRLLAADPEALVKRDVVIVTDTDPEARSAARRKLRPRGFSLVLLDKDGDVKLRKPLPWDVREITHAIDKFPLRRQEILEELPSGR